LLAGKKIASFIFIYTWIVCLCVCNARAKVKVKQIITTPFSAMRKILADPLAGWLFGQFPCIFVCRSDSCWLFWMFFAYLIFTSGHTDCKHV
jgi:hypothetical protein